MRKSSRKQKEIEQHEGEIPDAASTAPWLVFSHGEHQTFCSISESNQNQVRKSIPELRGTIIEACRYGWLLLSSDGKRVLSLWNPTCGKTIKLPPLDSDFVYTAAFLTLPPADPDSRVLLIADNYPQESSESLACCHPGDGNWIILEDTERELHLGFLNEFATHDGRVYGISDDSLFVFEVGEDNKKPNLRNLQVPMLLHMQDAESLQVYLVESCGELLAVALYSRWTQTDDTCLYFVKVFKLDFLQMAWVEIKSLENQALFLQRGSSISCSATEAKVDRDSIFFMSDDQEKLLVFNMEQGSLSVQWPKVKCQHPPCWMMPPYIRFFDDEQILKPRSCDAKEELIEVKYGDCTTHVSSSKEGKLLNLPNDILTSIVENLSLLDYMSTRASCKTLRCVAPASSIKFQTTSPLLVFLKHDGGICNVVDPKYPEVCHMNFPQSLQDARVCFSKNGWLLMMKLEKSMRDDDVSRIMPKIDGVLFFFNPFTKEVIKLLPGLHETKIGLVNIAFSSLPTSPNCWVVAVAYFLTLSICYKRLGSGRGWRVIETPRKGFVIGNIAPVFFDEAFYFLSSNGMLCCLKLKEDDHGRIIHSWDVVIKPRAQHLKYRKQNYLVECDGKLLKVCVGDAGQSVKVMKLNFSKKAWEKVQNLGQYMLFVSPTSSFSAVAQVAGMENKIYFPRLLDRSSIVFYSLESRKYHTFHSNVATKDFGSSREQLLSVWIEPLVCS